MTLTARQSSHLWNVGGWMWHRPHYSFSHGTVTVDISAFHSLGPAVLTIEITGTIGGFTSDGDLRVRNHHVVRSSMGATGLGGQLTARWSLSVARGQVTITSAPSLTVAIPLMVYPIPLGDFPLVLSVLAKLQLTPQFSRPFPGIGGALTIRYSGSQGLTLTPGADVAQDHHVQVQVGQRRTRGTHRFSLEKLDLTATFPEIDIGEDFYDVLKGTYVWTALSLDTRAASGSNPGWCLLTTSSVHADVGVTVELFGFGTSRSVQIYEHKLGSRSWPASPRCFASY
jgi:hypothetical protein